MSLSNSPFWFASGATSSGGGGGVYPYSINQSLRFDGSTSYLEFTPSSAATDSSKMTFSTWVKLWGGAGVSDGYILSAGSSNVDGVFYPSYDMFAFVRNGTTAVSGGTERRDPASWYHVYVVYDADSEQKCQIYVNGELDTESTQTVDLGKLGVNGQLQRLVRKSNAAAYSQMYLAETHFIDGSIEPIGTFAEYSNGIWVPKETSGITYGTNGWYLPYNQDTTGGNSINFGTGRTAKVTHTDSASYDIGASDDFTIEFFFKTQDVAANYGNFVGEYATGGPHHLVGYDFRSSTRDIYFYSGNGQGLKWSFAGDVTISNNTWHHVVFQRNGTTLRAYIDGTRLTTVANAASSWTLSDGKATDFNKAYDLSQIILGDPHGQGLSGSLSNVRYVIGSSVYADDDNDITVPTATLTAVTGTKLLTAVNATLGDDISTENNDGSVSSATLSYDSPFTTSNFFEDASGNGNNWTAYGLSVEDVVPDSPTKNYCTMNALMNPKTATSSSTYPEGAIGYKNASGTYQNAGYSTFALPPSGKWYCEVYVKTVGGSPGIGLHRIEKDGYSSYRAYWDYSGPGSYSNQVPAYQSNGRIYYNGNSSSKSTLTGQETYTTGDILQIYVDVDNNEIYFGKNNTWQNSADPDTLTSGLAIGFANASEGYTVHIFAMAYNNGEYYFNFGQDDTFAGNKTTGSAAAQDANGEGTFYYTPPTNALALCSSNLAEPAIGPGQASGLQTENYFETITYTGTGAVQHIGSGGAQHPVDVITVGNSCRFNSGDSARFNNSSRPAGDRQQFTISFWFKQSKLGVQRQFFEGSMDSGHGFFASFNASNQLYLYDFNVASGGFQIYGGKAYTDTSKWYNMVIAVDTTQATNSNRIKVWIDNEQIDLSGFTTGAGASSWPDQNSSFTWNSGGNTSIGYGNSSYWDGYIAEFVNIDGSVLDPTSFGQYGSNGYWIPKDVSGLTFGDEGFYLDFSDNSTADALGTDSTVNGNDFTATNIATTDQMGDSPTQNFNIFDVNNSYSSGSRLSEGNLKYTHDGANGHHTTTFAFNSSGNWYWEVDLTNLASAWMGVVDANQSCTGSGSIDGYFWYPSNGYRSENPYVGSAAWSATATTGDIIGFQIKNEVMTIYKNGVSLGSPFTIAPGSYRPFIMSPGATSGTSTFNFGADDSFAGSKTSGSAAASDANGYGSFYYSPPSGALAIVDNNIPVTGIDSPDLIWIKNRSNARESTIYDTIRGPNKYLRPSANSESTVTDGLLSFDKQGFTVGSQSNINGSGETIVAWCWKADGVDNTFNIDGVGYATAADAGLTGGDITPTGCSINNTAGFSIIRYTGSGVTNQTIKHGLNKVPEMIWNKDRDPNSNNNGWWIANTVRGDDYIQFHTTNAFTGTSAIYPTSGDDTTITVGRSGPVANSNESGDDYIQYHWHSVEGFSKISTYVGNADASGAFVYTGFRPAWIMIKSTASGTDWCFYDNKRLGYNVDNNLLRACSGSGVVEQTDDDIDILSNGFKLRRNSSNFNSSGVIYTYFAMAESPFKYSNAR